MSVRFTRVRLEQLRRLAHQADTPLARIIADAVDDYCEDLGEVGIVSLQTRTCSRPMR